MTFIIGLALGIFLQFKFDIFAKIKNAIAWVKGLFNRG